MTYLALKLFALNVLGMVQAGLKWAQENWRLVAGMIMAVAVSLLIYKACFVRKPIQIDETSLEKIKSENKAERIKELTKVVEENADVIKTVDNRTELSEVNNVERNREVDARVKKADEALQVLQAQGKDVSGPELECILLPEKCQ